MGWQYGRRSGTEPKQCGENNMGFDYSSLLAFIIFGVTIGVVYGIVALGISLIYSGLDIVHFAHGEMYMFGAFFGLVLAHNVGVPYPIALIGAMVLTALLGMAVERCLPALLTRAGGGYTLSVGMIICGSGMSVALVNVAYFIWEEASLFVPILTIFRV